MIRQYENEKRPEKRKTIKKLREEKKNLRKIKKRKKKILLAGFLGQELLGPQASWRVIPCSQIQISTSAVSIARRVYRSTTLKSLEIIGINSRYG